VPCAQGEDRAGSTGQGQPRAICAAEEAESRRGGNGVVDAAISELKMEKTWKDASRRVLAESDSPMHCSEITEQILSRGYYKTDGATPAATVGAQLAGSIKHDAEKSPFVRVGRGMFALRSAVNAENSNGCSGQTTGTLPEVVNDELSDSIVHAFGMYWQRDLVIWRSEPRIFGKQQASSKPVDFGKQKGIYLLCDHHTVVYIGRAIDRPLGKRLFEHTVDRLGSRWNRFSWFGLLDVTQEGNLREAPLKASIAALVATLEALLIETLEPPQNRKRGDDLSSIEYIQDFDPELKERRIQDTLRTIEQRMRENI
jgi:hypothetical protein